MPHPHCQVLAARRAQADVRIDVVRPIRARLKAPRVGVRSIHRAVPWLSSYRELVHSCRFGVQRYRGDWLSAAQRDRVTARGEDGPHPARRRRHARRRIQRAAEDHTTTTSGGFTGVVSAVGVGVCPDAYRQFSRVTRGVGPLRHADRGQGDRQREERCDPWCHTPRRASPARQPLVHRPPPMPAPAWSATAMAGGRSGVHRRSRVAPNVNSIICPPEYCDRIPLVTLDQSIGHRSAPICGRSRFPRIRRRPGWHRRRARRRCLAVTSNPPRCRP